MSPPFTENEITVYGRRAVLEALEAKTVSVERVAVAKQTPADFRAELGRACRAKRIEPETLSLFEVGKITGDARNDQGVVALIRLTEVTEIESFTESLTGARAGQPTRIIALDNITNPQNVGMVVRSAAAAGVSAMLWPRAGMPWVNGLIIKSSAATVYRTPIVRCHTLVEGLFTLKRAGFTLFGLVAGEGESLFSVTPPHRACFVIGGEVSGISPEVLDVLDRRVNIPMAPGVESLNAAVAAAFVCYAATGLLGGAGPRR